MGCNRLTRYSPFHSLISIRWTQLEWGKLFCDRPTHIQTTTTTQPIQVHTIYNLYINCRFPSLLSRCPSPPRSCVASVTKRNWRSEQEREREDRSTAAVGRCNKNNNSLTSVLAFLHFVRCAVFWLSLSWQCLPDSEQVSRLGWSRHSDLSHLMRRLSQPRQGDDSNSRVVEHHEEGST